MELQKREKRKNVSIRVLRKSLFLLKLQELFASLASLAKMEVDKKSAEEETLTGQQRSELLTSCSPRTINPNCGLS